MLSTVPEGCRLHLVTDDWCEPHVHLGEFAIIDPNDREPVFGEPYLLQMQSGPRRIWRVCEEPEDMRRRASSGEPCAMLRPLQNHTKEEIDAWMEGSIQLKVRMSDGPIFLWALREKIIGRVIGVYKPMVDIVRPALEVRQ